MITDIDEGIKYIKDLKKAYDGAAFDASMEQHQSLFLNDDEEQAHKDLIEVKKLSSELKKKDV